METGQLLIYQSVDGAVKVDVRFENETVWLSQAQICTLFQKSKATVSEHISNVFHEGELSKEATVRKFRTVQKEGLREVERDVEHYNLDIVISVGYRIKSQQGTQFRIWATQRLKEYMIKGFVLNDDRFKSGNSMNYFQELQDRIREIRLSERFFYQKIKDIYTTSIDYDPKSDLTFGFFKMVQNKLLWAISQQTAAELVYRRADASKPLLGMLSFDKRVASSIRKADVSIAKNYLTEDEMKLLGLLVEQFLAFAETMAQQLTPMYMADWVVRLDAILQLNRRELLHHAGSVSHEKALEKSEGELDTFRTLLKSKEKEESIIEIEADLKKLKPKE